MHGIVSQGNKNLPNKPKDEALDNSSPYQLTHSSTTTITPRHAQITNLRWNWATISLDSIIQIKAFSLSDLLPYISISSC